MQQLAPHIVAPTAISSTDSITNQYSQARLQITPHSTAPVQQLTPQIVGPAAIVSTDSISNQYRSAIHMAPPSTGSVQELTPQIVGPMATTSTDSNLSATHHVVPIQYFQRPAAPPFQYHLHPNFQHLHTGAKSSVTTVSTALPDMSQGIRNSKPESETILPPSQQPTKVPEVTGDSIHHVDEHLRKMAIATSVDDKPATVTNAQLHSVTAFVESDDNIPKSVGTALSSTFVKVNPPVKNSSNVNILSNPIMTQTPSHGSGSGGPLLKDRLKSLEKNMTQLFSFITTTLSKNESSKPPATPARPATPETKVPEENKEQTEKMFDDDDDPVINASPGREMLSEQIGTIISMNSLFEANNVETYQEFKDEVSLNSTVHLTTNQKTKKGKVGRPRKQTGKLFLIHLITI